MEARREPGDGSWSIRPGRLSWTVALRAAPDAYDIGPGQLLAAAADEVGGMRVSLWAWSA